TSRRVRILQALSAGGIGGTEMMVQKLVAGLDRASFDVEVSVLDEEGAVSQQLQRSVILVHRITNGRGWLHALRSFRALLAERRYDVVHLYGFRVSLLGRLAAGLVRPRPFVIHGIRGLHVTEGEDPGSIRTRAAVMLE